jgi:hypothetical protein
MEVGRLEPMGGVGTIGVKAWATLRMGQLRAFPLVSRIHPSLELEVEKWPNRDMY